MITGEDIVKRWNQGHTTESKSKIFCLQCHSIFHPKYSMLLRKHLFIPLILVIISVILLCKHMHICVYTHIHIHESRDPCIKNACMSDRTGSNTGSEPEFMEMFLMLTCFGQVIYSLYLGFSPTKWKFYLNNKR